jgi:hypothetical protein
MNYLDRRLIASHLSTASIPTLVFKYIHSLCRAVAHPTHFGLNPQEILGSTPLILGFRNEEPNLLPSLADTWGGSVAIGYGACV